MGDWANGICGCFGDIVTCLLSFVVPCYQFGKNSESIGENCLLNGLSLLVPILGLYCRTIVRGKIRDQKNIDGTCLQDLLCVWFCSPCSLAQESQELAASGNQPMARE